MRIKADVCIGVKSIVGKKTLKTDSKQICVQGVKNIVRKKE